MLSLPSHLCTVVNQDGAAVLDVSRNQISTLNSTGGFVWERLQQGQTVEEIIRGLANESNTDLAIVERGVQAFLEQLKSERLLSI
ncbi:6-phosphogluconate dehydrogenase (decarboxylating) [Silvibacterium bohemicum]|uniref:6-phosphogluconate dehydrogenase (Decarboxylating) n=1 Tax=Silvibacterium bohemicum TaxID=1577686 RepID=A0A841JYG1_9BACT|nr:PqqD family protein [Silvibacterium bohemicum]MBB6143004.1 6-phosphogluconate dehydrogenase (decarboxylating) [Silvibacterium bohemicum]